jgi:hypothetical protein
MKCKFCGKEFNPKNKRQCYCSAKCKVDANRERRKQKLKGGV